MAGKKTNGYVKTGALAARRQERRDEAAARQKAHNARTPEQQLVLINTRHGESLRERTKLLAQIN